MDISVTRIHTPCHRNKYSLIKRLGTRKSEKNISPLLDQSGTHETDNACSEETGLTSSTVFTQNGNGVSENKRSRNRTDHFAFDSTTVNHIMNSNANFPQSFTNQLMQFTSIPVQPTDDDATTTNDSGTKSSHRATAPLGSMHNRSHKGYQIPGRKK